MEQTPFVSIRATLRVTVSPRHANRIKKGVNESINNTLFQYSEDLQGIPVVFQDIQLNEDYARIYSDNPFFHVTLSVSFLVFQPKIGSKMRCTINTISKDHIGTLIYGIFNGFIPSTNMEKYRWSSETSKWVDSQDNPLSIGQPMMFIVDNIDIVNGAVSIRGRL